MGLNRKAVKLSSNSQIKDAFINASPAQRISLVWDLTAEVWGMNGSKDAERRLQRNITRLIRKKRPTPRGKSYRIERIKVPLLSEAGLIKNKTSTGRVKDKLDAEELPRRH